MCRPTCLWCPAPGETTARALRAWAISALYGVETAAIMVNGALRVLLATSFRGARRANPESGDGLQCRDSPMRNCASEVQPCGLPRNDRVICGIHAPDRLAGPHRRMTAARRHRQNRP